MEAHYGRISSAAVSIIRRNVRQGKYDVARVAVLVFFVAVVVAVAVVVHLGIGHFLLVVGCSPRRCCFYFRAFPGIR